jgi:hypothetical protein
MTIALRDAPGGPAFIERLAAAVADLALFFCGEPDDRMHAALRQTRMNLETKLSETFGAETAARIAQAFVTAVTRRKAEIDRIARVTALGPPHI